MAAAFESTLELEKGSLLFIQLNGLSAVALARSKTQENVGEFDNIVLTLCVDVFLLTLCIDIYDFIKTS